jgi:predicted SPOUT superfamily RNA methylase MTH1
MSSADQQHHKRARLDEKAKANLIHQQDKGRRYTVSLAIPGSIIDNAQTKELKTVLAGQIARAAAIFKIDEVVVFDDRSSAAVAVGEVSSRNTDGNAFLAHVLQYLETPQYLRKQLFPRHHHLQFAGLLSPLDTPHHLRKDEACRWREGIVVAGSRQRNHSNRGPARSADGEEPKEKEEDDGGSDLVHVGLNREIKLDRRLKPGVRVTVEINLKGQHKHGGASRTKGKFILCCRPVVTIV